MERMPTFCLPIVELGKCVRSHYETFIVLCSLEH